eukprot:gnl/TRDRNA2_/TRDRNA2_95171_c0_seq1.p1 gnl/TRDRNA2_/TRDRNA2_95171_c0~~gnl/TRDRNA2_/TRDRNA2_95171_c0_seq1.p1  ORF type:complete len:191 (+),score=16.27 gnl/TRDRNA2_/TRDRNA2_95171_c0_seq1:68-640(+)
MLLLFSTCALITLSQSETTLCQPGLHSSCDGHDEVVLLQMQAKQRSLLVAPNESAAPIVSGTAISASSHGNTSTDEPLALKSTHHYHDSVHESSSEVDRASPSDENDNCRIACIPISRNKGPDFQVPAGAEMICDIYNRLKGLLGPTNLLKCSQFGKVVSAVPMWQTQNLECACQSDGTDMFNTPTPSTR